MRQVQAEVPVGILSAPSRRPPQPRSLLRAARWALPALALGGCFLLPHDGEMMITGSVVSESGEPIEDCTLILRRDEPGGREREQQVSSTFDTGFTVSPSTEDYVVTITCPGYPEPFTSKVFSHSGRADEPPVDLGTVVMKTDSNSETKMP